MDERRPQSNADWQPLSFEISPGILIDGNSTVPQKPGFFGFPARST